jgi:hypothetical protein
MMSATDKPYTHLPEPVNPKDVTTTQPTDPVHDPDDNPERDFLHRYGAAGDLDLSDA